MPIAFSAVDKVGGCSWRYAWAATTGPYRVYYRGELVAAIDDLQYTISEGGAADEPPALEVLDANDTDPAQMLSNPQHVVIQWRGSSEADYYRLDHYENSAWTVRAVVKETGRGYYQYMTDAIEDDALEEWALYAMIEHHLESYPIEFHSVVVRNPDPPAIEMTYDKENSMIHIEGL